VTRYGHGTIAWTELFAGDVAVQRDFYARLFGWRFDDRSRAHGDDGAPVCAIRACADDARGWAPFVAVDDVDAVHRAAIAAGGARHHDELVDPTGAHFFVWDGAPFEGPHRLNQIGSLAWNEIWSPDPAITIAFYRAVLSWSLKEQPGFAGAPYLMFAGRDRPSWTHAGIRSLAGEVPAHWMSYFEVASCAASVELARGLGATITMPATHVAGVGWIATAIDREGSAFGLMQSG